MAPNDAKEPDDFSQTKVREVEFSEYRELLVSRRKLERVGARDCLRDVESDELFVLKPSDRRLAQCV